MKKSVCLTIVFAAMCVLLSACASTAPKSAPSGFVRLTDAVPDAILEIRYYSTYNFVGDRIDGYEQPTALLTAEAARALKEVSDDAHIYIEATASDQNGDDWILIYDEQALEGIDLVSAPQKAKKVLENGQLLIIQGDRKFTITGSPSY